ncbi:MAG: glycogen synthase [Anaerolineales bacterium]|nr:glycogen synthase [Anaerolineales bacterium]
MNLPMRLRVLFVAAEAEPLIKVGGLGDVAGSLPQALTLIPPIPSLSGTGKGVLDIRLVIPFHGAIRRDLYDLRRAASYSIPHASGSIPVEVFTTVLHGLPVYLVSGPPISPDGPIYSDDSASDGHKYTFFSLAALELARALHWPPHILHVNDWTTAAAIYSLAIRRPCDSFYKYTSSILTLHNLPGLGIGAGPALEAFDLPPAYDFHLPEWAQHLPLPLGLLTADHIVTVSPTYAQEIFTPEFGLGLHDFLRTRADSVTGILNGIDTMRWDPSNDPNLATCYNASSLEDRINNKLALQKEFGLEVNPQRLLLAIIGRMDYQKGLDLAFEALRHLILSSKGRVIQIIFLGIGKPEIEESARQMEENFPEQVRAVIRFDGRLSRRIFASADALLIPSRYEPCGLTQMIALRYGCVPIGRATGGLRDTIRDYHDSKFSTGFLFQDATSEALAEAILRAMEVFSDQQKWRELIQRGMGQDFSWERSAREYLKLYQELVQK